MHPYPDYKFMQDQNNHKDPFTLIPVHCDGKERRMNEEEVWDKINEEMDDIDKDQLILDYFR